MVNKLDGYGYCTLCQRRYRLDELAKIPIPKLGVYAYYCRVHKKQVRLKPRGYRMSTVKEVAR